MGKRRRICSTDPKEDHNSPLRKRPRPQSRSVSALSSGVAPRKTSHSSANKGSRTLQKKSTSEPPSGLGRTSKSQRRGTKDSDKSSGRQRKEEPKALYSSCSVKPESTDQKTVSTTSNSRSMLKLVGAHVSAAGGLQNAVTGAVAIGANAFALFLRSQRTWNCKPLSREVAEQFRAACQEHGFPSHAILPHGSYLLNLGSPEEETLRRSREALVDEMKRCEMLGLTMYNFHPGSTCGKITVDECIGRIVDSINTALDNTSGVTAVVENMSRQGNTVGGRFEELHAIVQGVKDKSRIGVCLDTCHAFAAGFDLRTQADFHSFIDDFDRVVGLKYLRGMHLNDSKGKLGCHLDRHENIGKGELGLDAFRWLMNDSRLDGLPLILETPAGLSDAKEIKLLRSLVEKKNKPA